MGGSISRQTGTHGWEMGPRALSRTRDDRLNEIPITLSSERMSGESEALADTIWTGIQLQQGADSSGLGTLHLDNLVEAVGFLNYTTSPCP